MMRVRARTLVLCLGAAAAAVLVAGELVSACVFDAAGDCENDRTCKGVPSSSSSSGSSSSSSGTAGAGGSGCKSAADCPGPGPDGGVPDGGVCFAVATCTDGKCGLAFHQGKATDQPYGTCMQRMCDEDGGVTTIADDTNVWDAGNPCIVGGCADGGPTYTVPVGGPCPAPSPNSVQGTCVTGWPYPAQLAACVQCTAGVAGADCSLTNTTNCSLNAASQDDYCVGVLCVDGVKETSNGETDVDCGGANCAPCADGYKCLKGTDCQSGICNSQNLCAVPLCGDNVKNGGESDVDCGGPCMKKCNDTQICFIPSDCVDQVCIDGVCQPPTCTDGVQNGDETGVDCGGVTSACPPCPLP